MLQKQNYINDEMSSKIVKTVKDLAKVKGANSLSVRDVLNELDISNRVFYNRFNNIDEVLKLIYQEIADSIHQEAVLDFSSSDKFFDSIIDYMERILIDSYTKKGNLSQYIFEQDSISNDNFVWWNDEIKRIINHAIQKGFVKDLEPEKLSYAFWCFIRGFNADALSRRIPLEESLEAFRYSFKLFLNGLKPNN